MEEEDGQLGSGPACAKGICLQWYRWEGEEGKVLTKQNDGDRGGGEGRGVEIRWCQTSGPLR